MHKAINTVVGVSEAECAHLVFKRGECTDVMDLPAFVEG